MSLFVYAQEGISFAPHRSGSHMRDELRGCAASHQPFVKPDTNRDMTVTWFKYASHGGMPNTQTYRVHPVASCQHSGIGEDHHRKKTHPVNDTGTNGYWKFLCAAIIVLAPYRPVRACGKGNVGAPIFNTFRQALGIEIQQFIKWYVRRFGDRPQFVQRLWRRVKKRFCYN